LIILFQLLLPLLNLLVDSLMLATKISVVECLPSINLAINDSWSANSSSRMHGWSHRFTDALLGMISCFPEIHEASLIGVVTDMILRLGIHHAIKACIDVVAIPHPPHGHGMVVLGNFVLVMCTSSLGIIIPNTTLILRRTFKLPVVLLFRRVGWQIVISVHRLGSDRGRRVLRIDLALTLTWKSRHYEVSIEDVSLDGANA
jgi:hypothetical protein